MKTYLGSRLALSFGPLGDENVLLVSCLLQLAQISQKWSQSRGGSKYWKQSCSFLKPCRSRMGLYHSLQSQQESTLTSLQWQPMYLPLRLQQHQIYGGTATICSVVSLSCEPDKDAAMQANAYADDNLIALYWHTQYSIDIDYIVLWYLDW